MKAFSIFIIGVLILIVVVLALALQAGDNLPSLDQWLGNRNPSKPKPSIIDFSDAIITEITRMKQLTTTIYTIQQKVEKRFDGRWYEAKSYRMVMVLKGTVEAGLDLNQLHASDVSMSDDGKTITVKLPPVKILTDPGNILSNDKDDTYVFISDFQRNAISKFDLETQIRSEAGGNIIQTACNDDILKTANEEARATIEQLLEKTQPTLNIIVESAPVPTTCP